VKTLASARQAINLAANLVDNHFPLCDRMRSLDRRLLFDSINPARSGLAGGVVLHSFTKPGRAMDKTGGSVLSRLFYFVAETKS
jgi:hypothetical protein